MFISLLSATELGEVAVSCRGCCPLLELAQVKDGSFLEPGSNQVKGMEYSSLFYPCLQVIGEIPIRTQDILESHLPLRP